MSLFTLMFGMLMSVPLAPGLQAAPTYDFAAIGIVVGTISLGIAGVILAGSALFPELAENAKRTWIPNTIIGLVVIGIASFIIGAFT
ncbi:MAG: hypothetical protein AAF902_02315 [Chloroflexota bacterium]